MGGWTRRAPDRLASVVKQTEPAGAVVDWTQQTSGSFDEMKLPASVLDGLRELGFDAPTPVQTAVAEPAIAGKSLIIQSKTGSGKTAAFGIPLAVRLGEPNGKQQALVLAPTRELVQQVEREVSVLLRGGGHETVVVIGGVGYGPQLDGMRCGASVVVGTPGRVLDLIRKRSFDTSGIRMVVLDEADEMLSMGFWEEVTAILDRMPPKRQTLLLSATLPPEIERAAKRYLVEPQRIELAGDVSVVLGVENVIYYPVKGLPAARNLLYVLEVERPRSALVFCTTKAESAGVAVYLERFGYRVDAIHGDLSQRERERAMGRLRSRKIDILVATDIAARGIDISDLTHVVNHGLPDHPEMYVHRVGRTGRIGKTGTAITLLTGRDVATVSAVHKRYGVQFEQRILPPEAEIIEMQKERIVELLMEAAADVEFEMYVPVAQALCETEEGRRAVGFLLREYFSGPGGKSRAPRSGSHAAPDAVRLYVSCGMDEATDEQLREAFLAVDGVEESHLLGLFERQATSTFVRIAPAAADPLLAASPLPVGDRSFRVEVARGRGGERRERRGRGSGPDRGGRGRPRGRY